MPLRLLLAAIALVMTSLAVPAQTAAPAPAGSVTQLEAVTVSGVQPGPGLWQVRRGDHVLWILATLSPLPEKMQWQTAEVEQAIAGSQVVLGAPTVKIDTKVGFFGKLFLLPSLFSARKNPDGAKLADLVSANDYAQWQAMKARYIGRDSGIERWRPLFAALELYSKAIKKSALDSKASVSDTDPRFTSPGARAILKALHTYGMIVADGGNIPLMAESDALHAPETWDGLLDAHDLIGLLPSDFEVVGIPIDHPGGTPGYHSSRDEYEAELKPPLGCDGIVQP